MTTKNNNNNGLINYLYHYHPYYLDDQKNDKFNRISGCILNVKDKVDNYKGKEGMSFFEGIITKILSNIEYTIIPIPSSKLKNEDLEFSGIEIIVDRLTQHSQQRNGVGVLLRHHNVIKGDKDLNRQINSLSIKSDLLGNLMIKDKDVLIIDDVVTSGVSFEASKAIIAQYSPKSITCLALARTYNSFNFDVDGKDLSDNFGNTYKKLK